MIIFLGSVNSTNGPTLAGYANNSKSIEVILLCASGKLLTPCS